MIRALMNDLAYELLPTTNQEILAIDKDLSDD